MSDYYEPWEKTTVPGTDNVVLRSTGDHKAELWEQGIRGPARKGGVADYIMPVEVELQRVAPSP